jgi:hypothetical protein
VRIISHRANINGPSDKENSIDSIKTAIDLGFDVELDIWVVDGKIMLGHDEPQNALEKPLLDRIGPTGWFHCKNIEALNYFRDHLPDLNYFWHQMDDYTITSKGYFWTYPGKKISKNSIIVLPENIDQSELEYMIKQRPYAICTDWPHLYENK